MAILATELFANDTATTTLAADPGSGGTTLTVATGGGALFPAATAGVTQFRVRVDNELMLVTAHTANADTMTVTRGIEWTTGVAHAIGATVNAVVTAEAVRRWTPEYVPHPRHQLLLAWNMRPGEVSGGLSPASGTIHYGKVWIPENMTVTGVALGAQAVGTGYSNAFVGIYNSTGATRLAVSADRTADFATSGPKRLPFTGTVALTGGPGVYVLVAFVATFTGTTTIRGNSAGGHSLWGLTAASDVYNFFTKETAQSALPSSTDPTTGTTVPSGMFAIGLY